MIVIVSEPALKNEWLQEEVSAALEFGTRILPIRIGNAGALPPPLNKLAHLPWIDAGTRPGARYLGGHRSLHRRLRPSFA